MGRAVRKRTREAKKAEGGRLKVEGPVRSKYWRKVHEATPVESPDGVPASGQFNGARILGYKPPPEKEPGVVVELIRRRLREGRKFYKIQAEISRSHQVDADDTFREIVRQYGKIVQEGMTA